MIAACHHDPLHIVASGRLQYFAGPTDVDLGEVRPGPIAGEASEVDDGIRAAAHRVEQIGIGDRTLVDLDGFTGQGLGRCDDVDQACLCCDLVQ